MRSVVIFLLFSLSIPQALWSIQPTQEQLKTFDRPGWVVVSGSCVDVQISGVEAQRRAEEQARRQAVERVCGVGILSTSLVDAGLLRGDITETVTRGVVVRDSLLKRGADTKEVEGYRYLMTEYWVVLACSVVTVTSDARSTLSIRAGLDKATYVNGEGAQLEIKTNEECYVTVFNLWADGSLAVLFPNDQVEKLKLTPGKTFRVPDPDDPLLAHLQPVFNTLPGERENTEYIKVVATKTDRPFFGGVGTAALKRVEFAPNVHVYVIPDSQTALQEFHRWFLSIPADEVAVDQVIYRVVAK